MIDKDTPAHARAAIAFLFTLSGCAMLVAQRRCFQPPPRGTDTEPRAQETALVPYHGATTGPNLFYSRFAAFPFSSVNFRRHALRRQFSKRCRCQLISAFRRPDTAAFRHDRPDAAATPPFTPIATGRFSSFAHSDSTPYAIFRSHVPLPPVRASATAAQRALRAYVASAAAAAVAAT